jgi:hypothetical protein
MELISRVFEVGLRVPKHESQDMHRRVLQKVDHDFEKLSLGASKSSEILGIETESVATTLDWENDLKTEWET